MKRKLIILLMLIVLGVFFSGMIGVSANREDIYSYSISNGEVTITDCDYNASGEIVIPGKIENCPVTKIGYEAFSNCEEITGVTIPESVTVIETRAFYWCLGLKSINIPEGVKSIGNGAYSGNDIL